jgi:hypothetical protein
MYEYPSDQSDNRASETDYSLLEQAVCRSYILITSGPKINNLDGVYIAILLRYMKPWSIQIRSCRRPRVHSISYSLQGVYIIR